MLSVLNLILEIFKTPALILGFVAFLGLLLQRKKAGQVLSGTVKTALGLLVLSAGAGFIVSEILPL